MEVATDFDRSKVGAPEGSPDAEAATKGQQGDFLPDSFGIFRLGSLGISRKTCFYLFLGICGVILIKYLCFLVKIA